MNLRGTYKSGIDKGEITMENRNPVKVIEISGENRFDAFTKTRSGSRAVIIRDGMILLTHEIHSGW